MIKAINYLLIGLVIGLALNRFMPHPTAARPPKPLLRDLDKVRQEDGWVMRSSEWKDLAKDFELNERCDWVLRPTRLLAQVEPAVALTIGREEGGILCRSRGRVPDPVVDLVVD